LSGVRTKLPQSFLDDTARGLSTWKEVEVETDSEVPQRLSRGERLIRVLYAIAALLGSVATLVTALQGCGHP
jgi:hypothetical protein